jgi:hemerythrin-like metal-binding protein
MNPKSHPGPTLAPLRPPAAALDLPLVAEVKVTLLTWSHECIVGVQAMDDQHGILMDTLNELRLMLLRGATHRDVCLQLQRLIEFTQMHFQCEEQLLRQEGFPAVNEHRAAHQHLLSRLFAALEKATRDEIVSLNSLLEFLPSWYIEHVEQLDQPYGAWLNDRGVF